MAYFVNRADSRLGDGLIERVLRPGELCCSRAATGARRVHVVPCGRHRSWLRRHRHGDRAQRAGIEDFTVLDRADGIGGTWRDNLRALVAAHGLGPHLRIGRGVVSASFDQRHAVWELTVDDGQKLQAAAVVCAVGQLGRPALPSVEGRDSFAGQSWHSARWNHDVSLAGRRVAVIGTGSSAIQFVPEIARTAGHVDVYQRSAPYVLPKAGRLRT